MVKANVESIIEIERLRQTETVTTRYYKRNRG
jgi:hypothetical protein